MARVARLGVVIDSSGAKRGADETNTALRGIEKTAERTVHQLQKAAATLGVAFGVQTLIRAVDTYSQLDGRLRLVTGSSQELARVQGELLRIAQQTRQSYEGTIDLYTRIARSAGDLGLSQSQLLTVTERIGQALVVSGTSSAAAAGALTQLGQAFGAGTVRAEEFNSILEGAPRLAQAIAESLGLSVAQLRQLVVQGGLSSRALAEAIANNKKVADEFAQITPTISGALTQLNNAFGVVVAGSREAQSASALLAGSLGETARFMVEYKDAVVAVSVALGVGGLAFAAAKAGAAIAATAGAAAIANYVSLVTVVGSVSEAFALLRYGATLAWAAITGPVGIGIAALTAVAAAVYFWRTRQTETTEAVKDTTKSAQDLYAEAKKVAEVNWVPASMIAQIQNLGGQLRAAQQGGRQSVEVFRAAAEQWKDSGDKARTFAQALAEGDQRAKTLLQTTRAQLTLGGQIESVLEAQTKAQQAAAKATEERRMIEADYQAQVVQLGIELAERAIAAEAERVAAIVASERALADVLVTGQQRVAALQAEVTVLAQGSVAAIEYARAQQLRTLVTEGLNRATAAGVALSPGVIAAIVAEAKETQRLTKVREALAQWDGKSPFTLPVDDTQKMADVLRDMVGVVQLIASAFGDVGRNVAQAATGAQSILGGLQSAGKLKNAAGEKIGLGTALSGQGGGAALLKGLGAAGQIAAGALQVADALDLFGNRARARARQMREDAIAFNRALEDFALVTRTSLDEALRSNIRQANALIGQAAKATGIEVRGVDVQSVADLDGIIAQFAAVGTQSKYAERAFGPFLGELQKLRTILVQNEAELRSRNAAEIQRLTEDLAVRRFVAAGQTEAADAERLRLAQLREIADAEARYGTNSPYLTHLRDVQAAETAAAQAAAQAAATRRAIEQQQQQQAFGLDLTQRRQTLNGDARGAFVSGQTIQTNAALVQAQQLLEAGTITAAMFEELRVLLGDEMVQALKDFDAAVQTAKQAVLDDLAVRALVAQGKASDAEALRIEIANRKELEGVTDAALRQQILYVQGLEATAREQARLADEQRAAAEAVAEIDRRMLDVLRTLDPAKAAELETKQREIDRAKELASAASEMIRLRLEELYAMEDAARAQAKLTEEMERQKRTAEELASLTASVQEDYLRATGRTFEADMQRLKDDKETRLKAARDLGASQSVIDQIVATFDAKMNALIASQMTGDAASAAGTLSPLDGGIRATTNFASVSDTTALRMLDVQLSQLTVLREIAAKGGAGGGGVTVQITVTGSPLVAQTPQQVGRDLAAQLVPTLDEYLGRRLGIERRLVGNPVL